MAWTKCKDNGEDDACEKCGGFNVWAKRVRDPDTYETDIHIKCRDCGDYAVVEGMTSNG